ncbi:MAG: hypothetical protein NTV46_14980 [Verrucomicrobia bacterium]|nr:hypothetical protein [Verrucomicrobiota bacterium]
MHPMTSFIHTGKPERSRPGTCAMVLACCGLLASAATAETPKATIQVNLAQEKAPVSPTLYGIFMEEISHAFDGGIYAELIQNRSFEEGVLPQGMKVVKKPDGNLKMEIEKLPSSVPKEKWDMPWPWVNNCAWQPARELLGWTLETTGGTTGEMKTTEVNPMNAASSRSLALQVGAPTGPAGRVALINSGYWGINVQSGTSYELKCYLRPGSFEGTVTATLESKDGKVLGQHEFGKITPGNKWQRLTAKLAATDTDPQARFVLSFRGKGELQVDWISLFPPTYKNRPNGLRVDLAKHLEALKPSFVRYPGGCYVEGLSWESAPDWRKMVCPPEDRPGQWGYWQYRSTDGFGYHEFLQFCEDLGSGHPQPFPLKYVEIGNEHPPALYGDYYKKFRTAIKAKYPAMTVIMSMYWSGLNPGAIARAGDDAIDVVDEHAYKQSGWIRKNFDYFDKYPRKPWKVYVGEYAHHHGGGDWSAAMDDSVYLMMCERNGDLVTMASYAPLFVNVNNRSWGVNLIEFDAARSFVHASYHVQKVYAENRPDVNLATTVDFTPKPEANNQPSFFATSGYQRKDKTVVVKATNYNPTPLPAEIRIEGATNVAATGQHLVIRSDKGGDENSLDQPNRITPQVLPLTGCAKSFQVILPPNSVNVLRLQAK